MKLNFMSNRQDFVCMFHFLHLHRQYFRFFMILWIEISGNSRELKKMFDYYSNLLLHGGKRNCPPSPD